MLNDQREVMLNYFWVVIRSEAKDLLLAAESRSFASLRMTTWINDNLY
jgi:hypothetical protein